jgi:SAM-dependent methyltransferase
MENPEPMADVRAMHEANRAAWNEGAVGYTEYIGDMGMLPRGVTTLQPIELEHLGDLSWVDRAIHLQCASGADTLSLHLLGAKEVIGIDISDVHIENARRKTEQLGFPARFYRCDLLDTPHELDGTADLVYTGKGALNWLQDIEGWGRVVARLLRPGGRLYVYEGHPAVWPFKLEAAHWEWEPGLSYFRTEPEPSQGWSAEYLGEVVTKPVEEQAVKYERVWPVSAVINALIDAGLRLDRFTEHPDTFWGSYARMPPEERAALPQTFALQMTRVAGDA